MNLLEWLTAEEAEKQAKTDLISYYKFMFINILFGLISLIFGIGQGFITPIILGIIWLLAPIAAWYISKDEAKELAIQKVSNKDKEYILEIGKKTWQYFKEYL